MTLVSTKPPSMPPSGEQSATGSRQRSSTPFNIGAAGNHSHSSKRFQSDYAPYLKHDVRHAHHVSLDVFLREVCGCTDEWRQQQRQRWGLISENSSITEKLGAFNQAVGGETHRYAPFVALANAIFDELGHANVRFCRNDSKVVSGSHGIRKPDVVVVRSACLADKRITVESCDKEGPNQDFWWHEILAFNEFGYKTSTKVVTTPAEGSDDNTGASCSHILPSQRSINHQRIPAVVFPSSQVPPTLGSEALTLHSPHPPSVGRLGRMSKRRMSLTRMPLTRMSLRRRLSVRAMPWRCSRTVAFETLC